MRGRFICALFLVACAGLARPAAAGPLLLFDVSNNRVIYASEPDRPWYPASLTKIMTAYLAFEAIRSGKLSLESKLVSTEESAKMPASKIGIPVGGEISMDLGLRSLIVKSANDVAVMIAEAVSGSHDAFIGRMNETAKRLGMTSTHFVNPNGLPAEGQKTTARDLALLSVAVLKEYPQYAYYWAMPRLQIGKRRLRSHNTLLQSFEGADGIKTGFICDSGFNVVASATRNGRQLVAVVLGSPSPTDRTVRASNLLAYGFETYSWQLYFNAHTLRTLPIDNGGGKLVSIRDTITAWTCGGRAARASRAAARAQRQARLRRAKELQKRRKADEKAPAKPDNAVRTATKPAAITKPQ